MANDMTPEQLRQAQEDYGRASEFIRLYALRHLAYIRCHDRRADLAAEVVARGWKHWLALLAAGRDPWEVVGNLAVFGVRAVRCGRRLVRQDSIRDALSPRAQVRGGFECQGLPSHAADGGGADENLAIDALAGPGDDPADLGGLNVDLAEFTDWLQGRDREQLRLSLLGFLTSEMADAFHCSPTAVSLRRRRLLDAWDEFHGD